MFDYNSVFIIALSLIFFSIPIHAGSGKSKSDSLSYLDDGTEYNPINNADDEYESFLDQFNADYVNIKQKISSASWDYERTQDSRFLHLLNTLTKNYEDMMLKAKESLKICQAKGTVSDELLRSQVSVVSKLIRSTPPTNIRKQVDEILSRVNDIFTHNISKLKSILRDNNDAIDLYNHWLILEQEIATKLIKPEFISYLSVIKKIADFHGFSSPGHFIANKEGITTDEFRKNIQKLMLQYQAFRLRLNFLYLNLLQKNMKQNITVNNEMIAINLLEKMSPENKELMIFRNTTDIIQDSIKNKISRMNMMELANKFYISLGFGKLNQNHIKNCTIQLKTTISDNKYLKTWNFFNGNYRMIWTSSGAENDMRNMFQGVAMIHNILEFQHLPPVLQDWPNEVFKEAISGAVALSVFSPAYLIELGILNESIIIPDEVILKRQLKEIIKLIPILSMAMDTDVITLDVFYGFINVSESGKEWWECMHEYSGIAVPETTRHGFGQGTVENMIHGTTNLKKFLSEVLKYQFFQELCVAAGQFNPEKPSERLLHNCNLSGNENAGHLLKTVMSKGSSISWTNMVQQMTGQNYLDMRPLLNYYNPLDAWLKKKYGNIGIWLQEKFSVGLSKLII